MASDNSTVSALTRVRYVGQDFQTYVNETIEFLKLNYPDEYNDWVDSNMGMALIHLTAYSCMGLAFYMNRRTTDLYMQTAQSPNSISKIARMLNYTIEGSSVASADITVTLKDGPQIYPIYIEYGFKFDGPNGLVFEYRNDSPVIFNPGETVKTFTVYEGETKETVSVSDGKENQLIKLVNVPVDRYLVAGTVEVFVGNEAWIEKTQIPYDIGNFYEVNYINSPPEVKFGDGIAGSIPDVGKELRIRYVIGSGTRGRIGSGQITKETNPLIVRGNKVKLVINNEKPSAGGEDAEDLRKVKALAPQFFQSQDRAISKLDYDAIANTYPGVAKADAHIVRTVEDDLTIQTYLSAMNQAVSGCTSGVISDISFLTSGLYSYLNEMLSSTCTGNIVQVAVLQVDANNTYVGPSTGLLEELRLHLQNRADVVHTVKTVSGVPYLVYAQVMVRIKVNRNSVTLDVINRAKAALSQYDVQPYGLLVLRDYGKSLYKWEINKAIRDAQVKDTDIDYANIYITGPVDKLDSDGNLIIANNQIIVPGSVAVEPIITG